MGLAWTFSKLANPALQTKSELVVYIQAGESIRLESKGLTFIAFENNSQNIIRRRVSFRLD